MKQINMRESYCVRGKDCHGYGHFGAPRGGRMHNGIDVLAYPNQEVVALSDGLVTKIGYAYSDDLSYRYVQVEVGPYNQRYFYVDPNGFVGVGDKVKCGDVLGVVQDLCCRYGGIESHIHFEVKDSKGGVIDPNKYLESFR